VEFHGRLQRCLRRRRFIEIDEGKLRLVRKLRRLQVDTFCTTEHDAKLAEFTLEIFSRGIDEDVLDENVDFLKQIGLQEHLSMTRSNGLNMMLEKIRNYGKKYRKNG